MRIALALLLFPLTVLAGSPTAPSQHWYEWDNATGDWWGARTALQDKGIDLTGTYYLEVWGNPVGGQKQTAVYDGILEFGATVDLEKLAGWQGATFQTTWLWFSGQDISAEGVGNFMTVSSLVAQPSFRNYELWLEQSFLNDALTIRAGQFGADSEFALSPTASLFLNATFSWGPFLYMNMPNGGPAWPMTSPGVRVQVQPADWVLYRGAVFQGNVFEQSVNRSGFYWRLDSTQGAFFMHEVVFNWQKAQLPGEFKYGGWFQTGEYADVLATSTRSGNYGFYFFLDQTLYTEPAPVTGKDAKSTVTADEPHQGLGSFLRFAFGPPDRNYLDFYLDAGLSYTGLIPGRDADQFGIGFAYSQTSSGAQAQVRDDGADAALAEMLLEMTYSAQITPWLSVQPDVQYIIHPNATHSTPNALVLGFRTTVTF